tara:strand:- start:556 stop:870 length:315 start_codon:yes stop_codon:yes gene_type:complete
MEKKTVKELIENVATRWATQYNIVNHPEKQEVFRKLFALPVGATKEQVNDIIGNDSWTTLTCEGCRNSVDNIILISHHMDLYDSISLCKKCINKALHLLDENEL